MKTACASIGRWWAVYTRPLGAHSEFRVVFDLAEWERRPDDPEAWTIDVEELDLPTETALWVTATHGTAVVVKKLRQQEPARRSGARETRVRPSSHTSNRATPSS